MTTLLENQDQCVEALSRSALYGVLAAGFRHPESSLFRSLKSEEELSALREAIGFGGGNQTEVLMQCAHAIHDCAQTMEEPALVKDFERLFGHTSRGTVPPYETEYGTGGPFSQPQEMSDISGFFNAFGLELDPARRERFDHICCELEFMCFLCAKQAYALEHGDEESARELVRTQRIFLRDHLAQFGRTFCYRVMKEAEDTWHGAAARLASTYLDAECHRLDVAVERAYLPLRPQDNFDVPMACGSCSGECGPEQLER